MTIPPVAGTAAFAKFMTVLQTVADAHEPQSVAALARACGYPRATVHRIVSALAEHGMLAEVAGAWRLGLRPVGLASRALAQFDIRAALKTELQALRDVTGETIHLAVPAGAHMVYIDKLESPGPLRMASQIGGSVAIDRSAVGRAWLASLPRSDCNKVLADLSRLADTTALARLHAALTQARMSGVALDDEENEAGIVCYGVALCDAAGRVHACVSVSVLRFRMVSDPQSFYIEPLLRLRDSVIGSLPRWPFGPQGVV